MLNVNCQSTANKKAEFLALLDCHNPDIVIGTESWLVSKHLDSEFFPQSRGYTSFRQDRTSDTQGCGVFILVRNTFIATEQSRELKTDCEIIWIKLELEGCNSLYIASYYGPKENDLHSFEEFKKPEDHWSCIAHLIVEDMLKSAVIEEKTFKHSPWAGADNPLGPKF